MKIIIKIICLAAIVATIFPENAHAKKCSISLRNCDVTACVTGEGTCISEENDYCIQPPFITAGLKPNLLLLVDNSASMYDLVNTDTSVYNFCANDPATSCTTPGATCSGDAICNASVLSVTTTTKTYVQCPNNTDAECRTGGNCPPGYTCTWDDGNDSKCGGGNTPPNVCNKSYYNVTTTTSNPIDCTADSQCTLVPGDTCNNKCTSTTRPCLDSTYNNAAPYSGYFNQAASYCYSSKSGLTTCTNSGTYDEFDGNVDMPSSCTYGGSSSTTPYLCVNVTSGKVDKFVASGNFLNWLTMSKFDIEKSILTGGKYNTTPDGALIGETRGCSGRSFIKTVPGIPLTFAVRGGNTAISSSTSQATQYGQTYIEIHQGTYNTAACTAAMNDWTNVTSSKLGPLQGDTKCCLAGGTSTNGCNPSNTALVAANQAIHDCFWYFNGHGLSNLKPIENACVSVWQTTLPGDIVDPTAGDAICSSVLSHAASLVDGNTIGYLGRCFTKGNWDDTCALKENKDFCQSLGGAGAVPDPSSSTVVSQTVQNIPGFVMELGLGNLPMINDYTASANGTKGFVVAIHDPWNISPWPPTGLIQKYQDRIRFGVMTFQNNGAGSECGTSGVCSITSASPGAACTSDTNCSGGSCIFSIPCVKTCSVTKERQCYSDLDCPAPETCETLDKTDGGKIISYVGTGNCSVTTTTSCNVDSDCAGLTPSGQYCDSKIGDHSSGLINSIDAIPATSWTPFAEAFYNAIGYFARSNIYTATPPTSRSDASFTELPSPNTAVSYVSNINPSQYRCQSNNVLLVTDGMSTADQNSASESLATLYASQVPYTIGGTTYNPGGSGYDAANVHGVCPTYSGSKSVSDLAWVAKNRNIKTLATSGTASTTTPQASSESITTYVVYSGPQASSQTGLCDPETLMTNTAVNGGTKLFSATDPATLNAQIDSAFSTVAAKASSGTAASILSNSEGSGANILQAVFYPKKNFDSSTSVNWIGEMQNLWYYVDPYINNSTIREDTDRDLTLNLVNDDVVRFSFDNASDKTMVQRYSDANGDGLVTDSDKVGSLIDPDYISSIWRAGMMLWARDDASDPRTVYTGYNSTSGSTPQLFAADGTFNALSPVWSALQIPAGTNTDTQRQNLATKLIKYTRGTDQPDDTVPCLNDDCTYRNRKVKMSVCSNDSQRRCTVSADCASGTTCVSPTDTTNNHEWKLGDIISSTPRVQSTVRLNSYDFPSPGGYSDKSYNSFINSNQYTNRGMVYVGANDGMLHAFKLGKLSVAASGFQKASLTGTNLGAEQWAFIPTNVLPYLKYMSEKDYNHLYSIDGRTVIFDASIGDTNTGSCNKSTYWLCDKPRNGSIPMVDDSNDLSAKNIWRTVLISGMGLGGASRDSTDNCTSGVNGTCVKTPVSGYGLSSYTALDVTDPNNPKYLWEFSDSQLGFATSSPAIVRIGDKDKNGRWFAVFGSGPTGPINTATQQFLAQSNQNLRFYILDLNATPPFVLNSNYWVKDTAISNAFVGTMLGGSIDADRRDMSKTGNYQDDAIYAGYVKPGSDNKWTDGGVVRIMTKEDPNPANWVVSKVIDGIGPVTTAIARLQDTKNRNLWLYFGTGRYFYRYAANLDDNDNGRSLFGIKEPCYNTTGTPGNVLDGTCTTTLDASTLDNQTSRAATTTTALAAGKNGWQIDLDAKTDTEGAERVVTDTVALTNGTVFFTSFKPNMDICGYGGNSYLWGVKYDTGGEAATNALTGKALIQLSTGEFKEVDLSTAFTDKGNRRMATAMTGKPPSDAPPIVSSSQNKPLKKILHIQEH